MGGSAVVAVLAAEHVVVGPPAAEVLVAQRQVTDQLGQLGVVRVAAGVEVQVRHDAPRRGRPSPRTARAPPRRGKTNRACCTRCGRRLEVGVERPGQMVAVQHVQPAAEQRAPAPRSGPSAPGACPAGTRCGRAGGVAPGAAWPPRTGGCARRSFSCSARASASSTGLRDVSGCGRAPGARSSPHSPRRAGRPPPGAGQGPGGHRLWRQAGALREVIRARREAQEIRSSVCPRRPRRAHSWSQGSSDRAAQCGGLLDPRSAGPQAERGPGAPGRAGALLGKVATGAEPAGGGAAEAWERDG